MKLSIIIVNYNVKYFIEQCLFSVAKAIEGIEAEIFVVDNNSVDGSCELIKDKFPWVKLIENKKNTGFSVANNQAIRISTGEYILLLNPDTVVQESTFRKVIDFMDAHSDGGGLGVKMIDGKGNFLPESKRGIPTPMVAFYKIFGLSKLFPKSKTFSKYHLGYLETDEINEIEILSGAFMFMRKSVLDEIGLLDEEYFMYGEDIDLSYRIIKAGYKNYYYPETTIIHYKGESTKKGSINYVMIFYKAMVIFARKQLDQQHAKLFSILINVAIYFRAFLSIVKRIINSCFLPVVDAASIVGGFMLLAPIWAHYKFSEEAAYPDTFIQLVVPAYALIWIMSLYFNGGYERPVKLRNVFNGILSGTIAILLFYSVLSEEHRFSRFLLFAGAAWTFVFVPLIRYLLHITKVGDFKILTSSTKRVVLVGQHEEIDRVEELIKDTVFKPSIVGRVSLSESETKNYIGDISQMQEIVQVHKIDEIIFCLKDISAKEIISHMLRFSGLNVDFKIAPPEAVSIIGSNSIDTAGELYTLEVNSIAKSLNKKKKRIFDIVTSVILLVAMPVAIFVMKKSFQFIGNIFSCLLGFKTWVAYNQEISEESLSLPKLKKGVICPYMDKGQIINTSTIESANVIYAKNYKVLTDILLVVRNFRSLGN